MVDPTAIEVRVWGRPQPAHARLGTSGASDASWTGPCGLPARVPPVPSARSVPPNPPPRRH